MSRLRRAVRLAAASAVAAMILAFVPAPASAGSDEIRLRWDGHGTARTTVTSETFVGTPVVVPGDRAQRTLEAINGGPTAGTLTVSVVGVSTLNAGDPDMHHNPHHTGQGGGRDLGDLYDDLGLTWSTASGRGRASFNALRASGETVIGTVPLAKDAATDITIGYRFPAGSRSGNQANRSQTLATFDVVLRISGDTPAPSTAPSGPASDPKNPMIRSGGIEGFSDRTHWLSLFAGLAIAAGSLVVSRRLRRRRERSTHPVVH